MHSDSLHLAAAADNKYALPLAVMLRSAGDHLRPGVLIEAHIVDDGLSALERERVASSTPGNINLHWIARPAGEFKGLPNWGRMSLTTYHKLTLADWLPQPIEKVIWLDADTLVLADLAQLWRMDLGENIALAAPDAGVRNVSSRFGVSGHRELGLAPNGKYFNAGVMLIGLAHWRGENVGARAFDYLRRHRERIFFWDQEALNAVLAGKWQQLDRRWNWNLVVDRLQKDEPDPAIIHFSGNLKPWQYCSGSREHKLYYHSLDQTAWRGWRPPWSWRSRLLARYESSRLRAFFYPLEQFHLRLVRWRTRR